MNKSASDSTKAAIMEKLSAVIDPETKTDVVHMRLVKELNVQADGQVSYIFEPSSYLCPLAVPLLIEIKAAVASAPGIQQQTITVRGHVAAQEITKLINTEV